MIIVIIAGSVVVVVVYSFCQPNFRLRTADCLSARGRSHWGVLGVGVGMGTKVSVVCCPYYLSI